MGTLEKLSVLVIIVIMAAIVVIAVSIVINPELANGDSVSSKFDDARLDTAYVAGGALDPQFEPPALLEIPWGRAKTAIVILVGGDENHPNTAEAISVTRGYGSTYSVDISKEETFRIEEFAGRLRLLPVR